MCLKETKQWNTPCGIVKASTIKDLAKRLLKILKAIISRCIFVLYCFIAIWRVTQALRNDLYWLLLFALCPLGLETLHAISKRETNQLKWVTPNVLFFLLGAIPCIWLLELKLLDDRLMQNTLASTGNNSDLSLSQTVNEAVGINANDEEWTLALEQILIFTLVLAKWIAPKGKMSLDTLSQLLLVYIAAGADILELMEAFNDERVSDNTELVYIIMSAWSWSLLQFTIVLTAYKTLPDLNPNSEKRNENGQETANSNQPSNSVKPNKTVANGHTNNSVANGTSNTKTVKKEPKPQNSGKITDFKNGFAVLPSSKYAIEVIQIDDDKLQREDEKKKIHDQLRAAEEVAAVLEGRRCFDYFCCYNEIWGMAMSIFFQDGPFCIIRLVILLHYNAVTQLSIFFLGKNVFVIILLLNRIRVVIKEDKKSWEENMSALKQERRKHKDASRKKLGFPPKTNPFWRS